MELCRLPVSLWLRLCLVVRLERIKPRYDNQPANSVKGHGVAQQVEGNANVITERRKGGQNDMTK